MTALTSLEDAIKSRNWHLGVISENMAQMFFNEGKDTHEIARRYRLSESVVYNAIHAWREAGR